MTYQEIYKKAIEAWGLRAQFDMTIEECAELIEACSHCNRHRNGCMDELIEEVVDVENMVNQLKSVIYGTVPWKEKYHAMKRYKMRRVEEMLKEDLNDIL